MGGLASGKGCINGTNATLIRRRAKGNLPHTTTHARGYARCVGDMSLIVMFLLTASLRCISVQFWDKAHILLMMKFLHLHLVHGFVPV
jgi:hypothetical protein